MSVLTADEASLNLKCHVHQAVQKKNLFLLELFLARLFLRTSSMLGGGGDMVVEHSGRSNHSGLDSSNLYQDN